MVAAAAHRGRIRPSDVQHLPEGWEADTSKSTGQRYYRNIATGDTTWESPTPLVGNGAAEGPGTPVPPRAPTPVRVATPVRAGTPGEGSSAAGSQCELDSSGKGSCWSYASGTRLDCICEICTCGKHHCPLHVQKPKYDGIASIYQQDYPWRTPGEREKRAFSPGLLQTPYDKNHFQTTNGNVYCEHPVNGRIFRPKTAPLARTKFDANSTYRSEYDKKDNGLAQRPAKQLVYPPKTPFEHKSTSQVVYTRHDGETRRAIIPFNKTLPNTPFTGDSTYRQCYLKPEGFDNTRHGKNDTFMRVPDDRDFMSTKQFSYTKPPIHTCPAAKLPKKAPSRHTGHCHYHKSLTFGPDGVPKGTYVPYK
eukprot:TRINITY_DN11069_c0_g2_i1.p2 TRINITY_DN11069_c0_g2~~TRINITY_DN11069_c0_g2_i1.p2  ORF type:complete len:363 (+),score=106.12 TRINITY_DN11069_c0_g2_i1:46-1134(+)